MAKKKSNVRFSGTVGNVTYYEMHGKQFARGKSSLDEERVKTDPCFKNSLAAAAKFAVASKIGSSIYPLLPPKKKNLTAYRQITAKAMRLLSQELSSEEVIQMIKLEFGLKSSRTKKTRGPI